MERLYTREGLYTDTKTATRLAILAAAALLSAIGFATLTMALSASSYNTPESVYIYGILAFLLVASVLVGFSASFAGLIITRLKWFRFYPLLLLALLFAYRIAIDQ